MTCNKKKTLILIGIAALGLTTLAGVKLAGATPYHQTPAKSPGVQIGTSGLVRIGMGLRWRPNRRVQVRDHRVVYDRYDLDRSGGLDHQELDVRRFDRDRSGRLEGAELPVYWRHQAATGAFGRLGAQEVTLVSRIASRIDRNNDGKLIGAEKRGIDLYLRAMREFDRADRNRDGTLNRAERRRAGPHLFAGIEIQTRRPKLTRQMVTSAVMQQIRTGRV